MFKAFKALIAATALVYTLISSLLLADCWLGDCCQPIDISIGWRHDNLDWKLKDVDSPYYYSESVDSRIKFKDIEMYTINGEALWVGAEYYIRLKADYARSYKGRAHENFFIESPILYHPITVRTNDPVKRRSEAYDFNLAVGYPLLFCCNRLSVIPLVGFAFNRQHLRVKGPRSSDSWSASFYGYKGRKKNLHVFKRAKVNVSRQAVNELLSDRDLAALNLELAIQNLKGDTLKDILLSKTEFSLRNLYSLSESPNASFSVDSSSNCFIKSFSSNPFSSPSESGIASHLGLSNGHRTSTYRFSWYGFYLGADIAYSLDCRWTLFTELEAHFLDRCHRKRKSWTGVYFIDDHHKEGWAYGFDGVFGVTCALTNCWYATLSIDYKYWNSDAKHDDLTWSTTGARLGIGYVF